MAEPEIKKEEKKIPEIKPPTITKPAAVKKTPEDRRKEIWASGKMPAVIDAWNKKHPTTSFMPDNIDAAYKEFFGKDIMDETPLPVVCKRCKKTKGDTEKDCFCGRPTKYTANTLALSYEYLEKCKDEEEERTKQTNDKKGYEMTEYKLRVNFPKIAGLALHLGVIKGTIYDWAAKYPEFSYFLELLYATQENTIVDKGLSGDYNPTVAKMMLTKHGYKDVVKSEHTGEDGGPIKIEGVEVVVRKTPAAE